MTIVKPTLWIEANLKDGGKMRERSKLDPLNPEYMPLHRPKNFNSEERIKMKYVNRYNWYTDIDIKDPYRRPGNHK